MICSYDGPLSNFFNRYKLNMLVEEVHELQNTTKEKEDIQSSYYMPVIVEEQYRTSCQACAFQ